MRMLEVLDEDRNMMKDGRMDRRPVLRLLGLSFLCLIAGIAGVPTASAAGGLRAEHRKLQRRLRQPPAASVLQTPYLELEPEEGIASSRPAGSSLAPANVKRQVIALINAERAKMGLLPLREERRLTGAAQRHAEDMLAHTYFSHTSLDRRTPVRRMQDAGYTPDCLCSYAYGENIAQGQKTAEDVVRDWMNSPKHRKNILSTKFDDIGIGLAGTLWVQDFGSIRRR